MNYSANEYYSVSASNFACYPAALTASGSCCAGSVFWWWAPSLSLLQFLLMSSNHSQLSKYIQRIAYMYFHIQKTYIGFLVTLLKGGG